MPITPTFDPANYLDDETELAIFTEEYTGDISSLPEEIRAAMRQTMDGIAKRARKRWLDTKTDQS